MGRPSIEAAVVISIEPIIHGSGVPILSAVQPPAVPSANARPISPYLLRGPDIKTRGISRLCDAVYQAFHEAFADGKLFERDILIRFVGLFDRAGPANHDGYSVLME